MCYRPQHGAKAERKKVGNQIHYRIFKQDKKVSVEELTTKLRPIVEGLKAEGKKNMATMVPAEVAMLAARLERLLNEWAGVARGAAKLAVEGGLGTTRTSRVCPRRRAMTYTRCSARP